MPWQTTAMGWNQPALQLAIDRVLRGFAPDQEWDLGGTICVFPTLRSRLRFESRLAERANAAGAALTPPAMATVGQIDQHLLPANILRANELQTRAAFATELRQADASAIGRLLRRPPGAGDWVHWLALAEMVVRMREMLATHRHTFRTVLNLPDLSDVERERWSLLDQVESKYLQRLASAGLVDSLVYREEMLRSQKSSWDGEVYLVAVADLNPAQLALLEQASSAGTNVYALVHAPEALLDHFEPSGRLRAKSWLAEPLELEDSQISIALNPKDQALAALSFVAGLSQEFSPENIKIGTPDADVAPFLSDIAPRLGLTVESAIGVPATQSSVFQLLRLLVRYGTSHDAAALAEIFRHPHLHDWLIHTEQVASNVLIQKSIARIDDYREKFVPAKIPPNIIPTDSLSRDLAKTVAWILPLTKGLSSNSQSPTEWAKQFSQTLKAIYERVLASSDGQEVDATLLAITEVGSAIRKLSNLGDSLLPELTAEQALTLLASAMRTISPVPVANGPALESLGWLDLPLEPAPVLILTGMNEGKLSPKVEADLFLTDAIREALELPKNEDRIARDRYSLASILASHKIVQLIAGRVSADRDPLMPSRLILGDTTECRARRALQFFKQPAQRFSLARQSAEPIRIDIPAPAPTPDLDSLRVTAFRDYLICPYRFYLRHVLRLQAVQDDGDELAPNTFGSLVHCVLEAFGQDESIRDVTNADVLRDYLDAKVIQLTREGFLHAVPAVHVQLELLRSRLERFALRQAEWASQGWRIIRTEQSVLNGLVSMEVDGKPFFLRGKIDRIDVNMRTNEVAVLDYKTGDGGDPPGSAHRKQHGEWTDLQLPLYRHLIRGIDLSSEELPARPTLRLGYVLLPKDLEKVGFAIADWSQADLDDADATAQSIIRRIRKGEFAPLPTASRSFPEFSRICQDEVFREQV